jgi:hypothetical protein
MQPGDPVYSDPATGRRYALDKATGQTYWLDSPPCGPNVTSMNESTTEWPETRIDPPPRQELASRPRPGTRSSDPRQVLQSLFLAT